MSNYPPGVRSGTSGAPWNDPDLPECPECGRRIDDPDDHDRECSAGHLDREGVVETLEGHAIDAAYEHHRERQWERDR